ncbi:MAG: Glyoxalase ElbB [Calditrichaeota bacterium]|nr:Glyoxalase ElbB [Calditrichota bacterium]
MARVAVVMAGSGVNDGTEIHEATLALLHLDELGAEVQCFAPDKPQMHVIDHVKGRPAEGETRNSMVEAARIARGEIRPLNELRADDFDAVVFPGGFGAAKNLSTFAVDGPDCEVDSEAKRAILEFHGAGKVVTALCIAPAVLAKTFGGAGIKVKLTIGHDAATAGALEKMGAEHVEADVDQAVVDQQHRVVTTPAYMLGPTIKHVSKGIRAAMEKTVELAKQVGATA